MGGSISLMMDPETTPIGDTKPTFDPMYGFPNGRPVREMKTTEKELRAVFADKEFRDYCAHHYMDVMACNRQNYPWNYACAKQVHEWKQCQYQDYIIRMKEYERERRLRVRARRKREKAAQEVLAA